MDMPEGIYRSEQLYLGKVF